MPSPPPVTTPPGGPPDPDHHPPPSLEEARPGTMAYNCQSCVRRKVKCDRGVPVCSTCAKSKQECLYQAPPKPRRKKRKAAAAADAGDETSGQEHAAAADEGDIHQRLARYEHILRKNGLLPTSDGGTTPSAVEKKEEEEEQSPAEDAQASRPRSRSRSRSGLIRNRGKLLSVGGKSRYINSNLWLDAGGEDMQDLSDDAEDAHNGPGGGVAAYTASLTPGHDPVSGAFLGQFQDLSGFHPSHGHAMKLWEVHVQNVEPICRVSHVPTTTRMVELVSRQPSLATKAQECHLFAIYHFAVYTLTNEECLREFGQPRGVLLAKYEHAQRQALVNASWLKTTQMPVLQALVLLLICGRGDIDPHVYWILTGIAVRIAQRMGLHHDGEVLGLLPFDVQMRRRLFWQLVPLEGFAGQHSGTGISLPANTWDVKKPLNVNDDQIYPGMTKQPEEQKGATDMIYFLMRVELSEFYTRKAVKSEEGYGPSVHLHSGNEALINKVEEEIETKILRYCDIINPLHFLIHVVVRSAANLVRLRSRFTPRRLQTLDDAERRSLCGLAQKILDSDVAIYRHPGLQGFRWQVRGVFLWDALICVLTSLARPGFFPRAELDATWAKLVVVCEHHPELLRAGRPVHVSAGKAILEAFEANPPTNADPEPAFVTELRGRLRRGQTRSTRSTRSASPEKKPGGGPSGQGNAAEAVPLLDGTLGTLANWDKSGMDFDGGTSPGVGDWVFWDQFFYNAAPGNV